MTNKEFTELVDLFLDQEISVEDQRRLQCALSSDPDRKRQFMQRKCLHQATRLALDPAERKRLLRKQSSRRCGRSHRPSLSHSRGRCSGQNSRRQAAASPLPGWMLVSGMAASLLIAFVLLGPVFRGVVHSSMIADFVGSDISIEAPAMDRREVDPADLRAADLERYLKEKQRAVQSRSSLAARMRLLGLRPELTPADKRLHSIDSAQLEPKRVSISQAERLNAIQQMRAMPEPELLRVAETRGGERRQSARHAFDVQLVGY